MAFCLAAEEFVDDKLSNWYVRRNRRRFWKSDKGADKMAAYQTLYTVLVTLTKLCAPIVPFLAETLYQNLVSAADATSAGERASLRVPRSGRARSIDEELSTEMDALFASCRSARRRATR